MEISEFLFNLTLISVNLKRIDAKLHSSCIMASGHSVESIFCMNGVLRALYSHSLLVISEQCLYNF